jgi:hypothetical protein
MSRIILRPDLALHLGHLGKLFHCLSKNAACYVYLNDRFVDETIVMNFIDDLLSLNANITIIRITNYIGLIDKYYQILFLAKKITRDQYTLKFMVTILDIIFNITQIVDNKFYIYNKWIYTYFNKSLPNISKYRGNRIIDYDFNMVKEYKRDDPRLLTVAGLKSRGIPTNVIKLLYSDMITSAKDIRNILKKYVSDDGVQMTIIKNPKKIILSNFRENETEYIYSNEELYPLSKVIYMNGDNIELNKTMLLKHGLKIYIEEIINDVIYARYLGQMRHVQTDVKWISFDLYINPNILKAKLSIFGDWCNKIEDIIQHDVMVDINNFKYKKSTNKILYDEDGYYSIVGYNMGKLIINHL